MTLDSQHVDKTNNGIWNWYIKLCSFVHAGSET